MPVAELRLCALQSIDFCGPELDIENRSMLVVPFAQSWRPNNLSYAAYSMENTKKAIADKGLKMSARFLSRQTAVNPQGSFLFIRAKSVCPLDDLDTLGKEILGKYPGENILGDIPSTQVYFEKTGQSSCMDNSNIPFDINNANIQELGVGVYDICWQWEYIETEITQEGHVIPMIGADWTPFERSMHRVFVTLKEPQAPWSVNIFNDVLYDDFSKSPLWAEVLLWACKWARKHPKKVLTIEQAAANITNAFYESGVFKYEGNNKEYSTLNLSSEMLERLRLNEDTYILFKLFKIIERLNGGNGAGAGVKCDDCALAVASLTNLLGGNLQVGRLQGTPIMKYTSDENQRKNRFELNKIKAIGRNINDSLTKYDSNSAHFFLYHSIAWLPSKLVVGGSDFNDPDTLIFDACLRFVEGKDNKTLVPAAGMKFGTGCDDGYRARLAIPGAGVDKCIPQPATLRQGLLSFNDYTEA